jgi:hypothetical protein
MTLPTGTNPISLGDIATEYYLTNASITNVDFALDRFSDIAKLTGDNMNDFHGKSNLDRFSGITPDYSLTAAGNTGGGTGRPNAVFRFMVGINGSGSASPSVGWIGSKAKSGEGVNVYIYNGNIEVHVGDNDYPDTTLRYPIPSGWTNDIIREITIGYERNETEWLRVDGIVRDTHDDTGGARLDGDGASSTNFIFGELPGGSQRGGEVPSAAEVAPSNMVFVRADYWRNQFFASTT